MDELSKQLSRSENLSLPNRLQLASEYFCRRCWLFGLFMLLLLES